MVPDRKSLTLPVSRNRGSVMHTRLHQLGSLENSHTFNHSKTHSHTSHCLHDLTFFNNHESYTVYVCVSIWMQCFWDLFRVKELLETPENYSVMHILHQYTNNKHPDTVNSAQNNLWMNMYIFVACFTLNNKNKRNINDSGEKVAVKKASDYHSYRNMFVQALQSLCIMSMYSQLKLQ